MKGFFNCFGGENELTLAKLLPRPVCTNRDDPMPIRKMVQEYGRNTVLDSLPQGCIFEPRLMVGLANLPSPTNFRH